MSHQEKILDFKVYCYSHDSNTSAILDYLLDLIKDNPDLARKSINSLSNLPKKYYEFSDIKILKIYDKSFYELRVKSGNNICRFSFVIQEPNFIILLGFTKKTQKTEPKHLKQTYQNYLDYKQNQYSISFDSLF